MEFFIKKNATLPLLKFEIFQDGRSDFNNIQNLSGVSSSYLTLIDPINLEIKQCPPGKEWNPDTKRCRKITVKKTKKVRELIQEQPPVVNLPSKSCPPGKEINPKTNRCIKIKTKN